MRSVETNKDQLNKIAESRFPSHGTSIQEIVPLSSLKNIQEIISNSYCIPIYEEEKK